MQLYQYDSVTKEYLGSVMARENPLEEGEFLIPANATDAAPPADSEGYVKIFLNGEWTFAEDNRGETVYEKATGLSSEVTYLGAIPETHTTDVPIEGQSWDGDTWEFSEEYLLGVVGALRQQTENAGFSLNGIQVLTDQNTRTNLLGARIRAVENPNYTVKWKAESGFVTLNAAMIIAIADGVAAYVQKCFDAEAEVVSNIEMYNTPEEVQAAFMGALAS